MSSGMSRSFGREVDAYDSARPTYPLEAVDWLVPAGTSVALDLGAGTGKFTRSIRAAEVVAVEPDALMLAKLATNLPGVRALQGTAEHIPMPDDSVDVVTAAQAWHWVDAAAAIPEVARVLRPGGTLGLVWNIRDESVPWVSALSAAMGSSAAEVAMQGETVIGPPFGETERFEVAWVRELTPDGLLELVASRSYVITADDARRDRIFADVRELLATDPALAGRTSVEVPYRTHCFRARLTE